MNPDAVQKVEVLAKSFVPEAAISAARSPQEAKQIEDAKQVRARFNANQDKPLAALLAPEDIDDLSGIDIDSEVDRRIGEHTPPEEDRRAKAKKLAHEAQTIAEKGIEGIEDPGRQDEIVEEYVAKVIDIRGDAFRNLSRAEKEAIARSELSRQEVRVKIAELLKKGLSPTAEIGSEDERTLAVKMQEKGQKKAEEDRLNLEIISINDGIARLQQELMDYQPENAATGTPEGDLHKLLEQAQARINAGRATELTRELVALYGRDRERLTADKASVRQRAKSGEILVDPTEEKLNELAQLEEAQREYDQRRIRRDSLPQEINNLLGELQTRNARLQTLTLETAILDLDINPLAQKKKAKEQAVVLNISRIVTQAANNVLNSDVARRDRVYGDMLREKSEEAEDNDETTLYSALGSRWERIVTRGGKSSIETIRAAIETDWKFAIASGGDISTQVELLLSYEIRKKIKLGTSPDKARRILEDAARIRERLKTDSAFAEKAKAEYITNLISRRLATGEPISVGEQDIIAKYGWTKHVAQAVEQIVQDDETLKTRIEQIVESTGVEASKLEALREKYPSQWATILAILLSGVAVPALSSGKHWYDIFKRK
ncbi:MAG: hypothetical protein HY344_03025 [Candidatus Levybacteria bacterium]|nr:hypothetical protein [Candidatus Levybacteria bacterium]